jgi:hypothetical protein
VIRGVEEENRGKAQTRLMHVNLGATWPSLGFGLGVGKILR